MIGEILDEIFYTMCVIAIGALIIIAAASVISILIGILT